jgi:hypothetical protein
VSDGKNVIPAKAGIHKEEAKMSRLSGWFLGRASGAIVVVVVLIAAVLGAWGPASSQEPDSAAEREHNKALAAKMKEMAKPPTEAQLGAPLYPGAFYDARNSAGMSMGDNTAYIFMSADPPAKVVDFYAQKLRKQASEMVKGSFMIVLKGKPPFPEKGITIEPNKPGQFDPKYKTVVTFVFMNSKGE